MSARPDLALSRSLVDDELIRPEDRPEVERAIRVWLETELCEIVKGLRPEDPSERSTPYLNGFEEARLAVIKLLSKPGEARPCASDARVLRRVADELTAGCDLAETEGSAIDPSLRADIQTLRLIANRFDRAIRVTPGISSAGMPEEVHP